MIVFRCFINDNNFKSLIIKLFEYYPDNLMILKLNDGKKNPF